MIRPFKYANARALGQTRKSAARREAGDEILNTTAAILDMFQDRGIVCHSIRPNKNVAACRKRW